MNVIFHLQDFAFEWDEWKAKSNVEKHGVTFEEAAEVFLDPFHEGGDASVEGESRDFVLGYSLAHHMLLVVYVERSAALRIISARLATRSEKKLYERRG